MPLNLIPVSNIFRMSLTFVNSIQASLSEWLNCLRLSEYLPQFSAQGFNSVQEATLITVEDLEDVGILKLGHQKRFLLAVKKIKELSAAPR